MPRPSESAPEGYLTPREVAEITGRSRETVVRWLHEGILRGRADIVTPSGETRHHIEESSVHEWLASQRELATRGDVELGVHTLGEQVLHELETQTQEGFEPMREGIINIVRGLREEREAIVEGLDNQREEVSTEIRELRDKLADSLERIEGRQTFILAKVEAFLRLAQEQAQSVERREDETIELQRRMVELAEAQHEELGGTRETQKEMSDMLRENLDLSWERAERSEANMSELRESSQPLGRGMRWRVLIVAVVVMVAIGVSLLVLITMELYGATELLP